MLYDLVSYLAESSPLTPLREGFARGARRQWLSGVRGAGKSLAIAALLQARAGTRVHFISTPSQERAETLFADLSAVFGGDGNALPVLLCPSLESLLYEETSPDYQLLRERLTVLARLAAGKRWWLSRPRMPHCTARCRRPCCATRAHAACR